MENNIIFSTKGCYSGSNIAVMLFLYIGCMIAFFVQFPYILNSVVGYVIALGAVYIFILPFIRSLNMKKSYIDLCDDYITGVTVPEKVYSFDSSNCTFNLTYDQITNVEMQQGKVKIYFSGGSYLVQAQNCEGKVIEIINQKKAELS